ncbi:hypothetical protein OIDMADRAFT_206304 [Oidiodendron maius Zn]|uniref:DUF221-domain-containing protein n=1 Tax=Oidiodendron maius (strain Zn) TaxID=913774 RepID=A0A0C3C8I7_OIDMZ|nr:hypothetical protein OIDMADRAFT_206304 [Oidiodendron maius Zn]
MANQTPQQQGSSLSAFLATLIPVAIQAAAFFILFLILRVRMKRVYRPRTYLPTVPETLRSEDLPQGRFNWLNPFRNMPDEYVLNHQSLDGYLYLRFLKMLMIICFFGCCITFPVLFPVNATAGGGQKQFDLLSFANIPKTQKNRYYAHVFVGWIFFSFVLFIITRETIYCINLRNAYLMSPFNASRISSRTVLFTDVPTEYLKLDKLHALFGATIRRAWLTTDCKELGKEVEKRDKAALKLESAEIKLSKKANKRRLKAEKKAAKSKKDAASAGNGVDVEAGVTSEYLIKKDRPTHRLGKIPLIGKKVDTIEWSRSELKTLIPKIQKEQATLRKGEGKLLPAVFVEFTTQAAAQAAFRRMSGRKAPHMNPRTISSTPDEIIWKNLKIKKVERMGRKFGTNTFLTLMIIFWAIPVAVVGAISNINYLTDKVPFLGFINHIPPVILGVVTGLLPSVLLSVLMSLVPVVCRLMAKLSGEVTLPAVELRCQHWYMAFQVVQVFLVTTIASGASSVVTQIIKEPSSATNLLAENLPKASNFYISYIVVQGLGIAAGNLLNIGALVMINIVGKFLDSSPRKLFKRYITLAGLGWGTLYPQFGNLGIIALSYSIISPLVMGFATVGFALLYFAIRYNSFFVLGNNINTHGAAYGRGIQQLMTGVYISEVCLIGLFGINTAPGPIVLMAVFLGFTAFYHAMMRRALKPLTRYLPETLEGEASGPSFNFSDHWCYDASKYPDVPPSSITPPAQGKISALLDKIYSRLFAPQKFKSYAAAKALLTQRSLPQYLAEEEEMAYFNPSLTSDVPSLWIVRDEMGISKKECADTRVEVGEGLNITDEYARWNEKGKIEWDVAMLEEAGEAGLEKVPIYQKTTEY